MKKLTKLLLILLTLLTIQSLTEASEFREAMKASGIHQSKFLVYGGYSQKLYGYKDRRYAGPDKGDYLKSDAWQGGVEFYRTGFSSISPILNDIRFGGNFNFYHQAEYSSKKLYAVPGHWLSEETVPEDENDQAAKMKITLGFFGGIDKKWIGCDLGLTAKIKSYYEKHRERLVSSSTVANPEYEKTDGRGWVWDNGEIYPNFLLRIGLQTHAHFTISAFREDYDINYGIVQSKVVLPVNNFFTMKVGGYVYPTDAIFLEPVLTVGGFEVGVKAGAIINYQDDDITEVGIKDSLFGMMSIAYVW